MDELERITETLRRQRKDLESQRDDTLSRSSETAALLDQIEDLRVRSEKTNRIFTPADESKTKATK